MFTQILSTQFLQCNKQRDLYIGGEIYPPQNRVLGVYTVFSMSIIPKFRQHLMTLLYNFDSLCPVLFKFTTHHNHQTMHV